MQLENTENDRIILIQFDNGLGKIITNSVFLLEATTTLAVCHRRPRLNFARVNWIKADWEQILFRSSLDFACI